METYNAKLISADFEESTMEFEIQHEFTVKAGDYVILHKSDYEKLVSGIQSENGKLPIPHVRFQLPSDQQIVELAILFNDGNIDKEILTKMVSLADFIIDRLYENGDVSKPCSKEGN
jgi:hypothetical protein